MQKTLKTNKKTHWFHTDKDLEEKEITLTDKKLVHQITKVLKFHLDEEIVLADGNGKIAVSKIKNIDSETVKVNVINVKKEEPTDKKVNLFFAIPKGNKFELILEKGTEIGINSFHPIITSRTEKLNINKERSQTIIKEASEQSERFYIPKIFEPIKFEETLNNIGNMESIAFHTSGKNFWKKDWNGEVNILIGPEGGWTEKEIEIMQNKGIQIYKVGDKILKTETAAIIIPSLFLY